MPVRIGRGISKYPDYVIHPVYTKNHERGEIVLEAKLSIPNNKQLEVDRGQAHSYAKLLTANAYVLVAKEGIWIGDFDEDSMFKLPDEVKKLIESILEFLGAEKTNDPCVWSLEAKDNDSSKKDEEESKDDTKEEGGEDKSQDKEDVEDDKSRDEGDANDLLG